jgi:hypothetical protein
VSEAIDVFVKLYPKHRLRAKMAELVLERLALLGSAVRIVPLTFGPRAAYAPWVTVSQLMDGQAFADESTYHAGSKVWAAEHAQSDVYAVIDDDHLPLRWDWPQEGANVLRAHPGFALLASWSVNGEVVPELAMRSVPNAYQDDEVFEACGLGTPYFARRGQIPPEAFLIPGTTAHTYDPAMSDMARAYGKLGFLKNVRHNHLGIGFSTVSAPHWEATC